MACLMNTVFIAVHMLSHAFSMNIGPEIVMGWTVYDVEGGCTCTVRM